jgi:hypothetical protein
MQFRRHAILSAACLLIVLCNVDLPDQTFGFGPQQVDGKQAVLEFGASDRYAVSQNESPLKLTRGYPPVEIGARLVVGLLAANDQLLVLDGNFELIARKSRYGESDPQGFGLAVSGGHTLDVVWGITVASAFREAVEQALNVVKPQEKWTVQ